MRYASCLCGMRMRCADVRYAICVGEIEENERKKKE